jgi:hypothetical protein
MRLFVIIGIVCSFVSCSNSETFNRGYVISKSHLEPEQEVSADQADAP